MPIIKTLGPESTDSYRAAVEWIDRNHILNPQITCYQSMEEIFDDLKPGDYVVMPVGYSNRNSKDFSGWVDFHYYYSDILTVADIFQLETMDMVIVENPHYTQNKAIVHSSTVQLVKRYKLDIDGIDFPSSKAKALTGFIKDGYRCVVCSNSDYCRRRSPADKAEDVILDTFRISMIWVVYKVGKK